MSRVGEKRDDVAHFMPTTVQSSPPRKHRPVKGTVVYDLASAEILVICNTITLSFNCDRETTRDRAASGSVQLYIVSP